MNPSLPWDTHPDLTKDRLISIARLIQKARNDVIERHDEAIGDDGWVLGCRAFQAARFRISTAAGSSGFEWLEIIDPSKHFIFKIGQVPVRFYRGEANDPTARTLRQSYPELNQLAIVFPDERREMAYRFAVETDFDGSILAIKFAGLHGETPVLCWEIPLESIMGPPSLIMPSTEGVDLSAPVVRIRSTDSDQAAQTA